MDERSDAELLTALRSGDKRAYAALWLRHSGAARRHAMRLFPSRADDLVSDSFLAVYAQVTTTDSGPAFAFRSYLKAVMRNTAIRWRKDAENIVDAAESDQVDPRDALSIAEADSEAAEVLAALQELPERWQRVLWLAEVAEAPRLAIASDLGIKPNAVSALQRRARLGLRLNWLTRQIPVSLRGDEDHAARLFPRYLTEPANAEISATVNLHIVDCGECAALLHGLRGAAGRIQRSTLAVLLGTAGIGTASATLSSATTAAAVVAASGAGLLAWALIGGAAVTAGTLVAAPLLIVPETNAVAQTVPAVPASVPAPPPHVTLPQLPTTAPDTPTPAIEDPPTGRLIADPSIPDAGLTADPSASFPTAPERPVAAGPDVPGPAPTPKPASATDDSAEAGPSPGLTSPLRSTGYISPVLTGSTSPGDSVALQLNGARYTPVVAADGSWSFDTRGLQLVAGDYAYQAWAYSAEAASPAETGSFTVLALEVHGFEGIVGTEDMTVPEAKRTGLVVSFHGAPNGTVFVQSIEGHTALIPLDADGVARRRLVMDSRGWYYFTMRYVDADGFWGPGWEHALDVYDPDVPIDLWGPDSDGMTFEFVDP
ncbi:MULTISPECIES: sigma-70 family RNA polymerase sigma factor [unclassified Microbacterium]|uniref:sigma-70 family RNA polymerase sigma factor n=1 Tax=unclassified Microbacterium TaxID=2609290 RepID=UPI001AC97ACD|nr:sigma-70 family RNA polymerase sigma factor [Microbacterium sp.]MBN9157284.1 sigma-70 family RNA polymerase sigma factor [Microbacterium sp.]MBS1896468.1 sigma-70 family RNA polymerase sigma factor [Actinomycetota bacterium]